MIRESDQPPVSETSYILEAEKVLPLVVFEYVSPASYRKDYQTNFRRYESELKVPYYVLFYPEKQDLRVHRNTGTAYELTPPNAAGRYPIPELELELGLLDGWVRFWYRGELLPLPAELQEQVEKEREGRAQAERRATQAEERATQAESEAAQLRALVERLQAEKKSGEGP
jgi:hypothetical protein